MKDKYFIHVTRHLQDDTYVEVKDSLSFSIFGNTSMSQPGSRSGIEKRIFYHLPSETIDERAAEVYIQELIISLQQITCIYCSHVFDIIR